MEPRSSITLGSLLLRICVGVASVNLVVLVTQERPRFKMANNRKCTCMVSLRRLQLRKLPRVWGATQLVAFWCWPTDYLDVTDISLKLVQQNLLDVTNRDA